MLQKSRSKSVSKFKFLLILPLMLAMLTYVACSSTKTNSGQTSTQKVPPPPPPPAPPEAPAVVQNDQDSNSAIPFAVVEQVPIFPGCENLSTNEEKKDCMAQKITEYVNRNFNTNLGKELELTGINRIYVRFMVSATGQVVNVESRAPHPDLGLEAERVVGNLPDMEPAVHNGRDVAILYSLPITFQVAEPAPEEEEKDGQN